MIEIITITKNDHVGLLLTLKSTIGLRELGIKQIIVDSSHNDISSKNKKITKNKKGVEYFWCQPKGIAEAFNFGIKKSKSKYLWFVNGGDEVLKDLDMAFLLKYINLANSDLSIFDYFNDNKLIRKPYFRLLWPPVFNWIPHPSTIINRKLFKDRKFDENYKVASDGDLWMQLMLNDVSVDLLSIPIAKFSTGGVSSDIKITAKEVSEILWKYKRLLLNRWLDILFRYIRGWIYFKIK